MTIRITYKIGKDDHTKNREVEMPAKPSNEQAQLAIAEWWKLPVADIIVLNVIEVNAVHPLSPQGLTDRTQNKFPHA